MLHHHVQSTAASSRSLSVPVVAVACSTTSNHLTLVLPHHILPPTNSGHQCSSLLGSQSSSMATKYQDHQRHLTLTKCEAASWLVLLWTSVILTWRNYLTCRMWCSQLLSNVLSRLSYVRVVAQI
jgi:hypothetical protein